MRKVLIIFATREGQTEKVARRIAAELAGAHVHVRLLDAKEPPADIAADLGNYDLLVFGASMHAGGLEREIVDLVNRNGARIEQSRRSFFLVLLSAATKQPELREKWLADARAKMEEQLEVDFPDCEMIAGALAYTRYSAPVRWMMKRIAGKAGGDTDTSRDYEYTDWKQVERYARRLLDALPAAD